MVGYAMSNDGERTPQEPAGQVIDLNSWRVKRLARKDSGILRDNTLSSLAGVLIAVGLLSIGITLRRLLKKRY